MLAFDRPECILETGECPIEKGPVFPVVVVLPRAGSLFGFTLSRLSDWGKIQLKF